MRKKLFLLRLIIGLIIIITLLYPIGIKKILITLSNINLLVFPIAILLDIVVVAIGAFNTHLIINKLEKKIKLRDITKYTFIGWALGHYTPSKIGEFSLALFLRKYKINIGKTTAAVLVDIIITIIVLTVMGFLGLITILNMGLKNLIIYALIIITLSLIIYLAIISKYGRDFIKKYILKKYSKIFKGFYESIKIISKEYYIITINVILTILKFIISSIVTLLIFLALGEKVPLIPIILITAITVLISTIPITINGLGLKETSAVYFYSLIYVKPEVVISVYVTHTIIQYIISIFTLIIFSKDLAEVKKSIQKLIKTKKHTS